MKKICILLVFTILSLSACTQRLYDHMIINGFGIDEEDGMINLSVRYASLTEQDKEETIIVSGESVFDAINNLSLSTGKTPIYSSANYIICGKTLSEDGLDSALDFFIRYFRSKPTMKLYMAYENAEDVITYEIDGKLISSSDIENCTDNSENKGKTVSATVMSFISDSKSESNTSLLPVLLIENDSLSAVNSAVFKDYDYQFLLSEEETLGYLAVNGTLQNKSIVLTTSSGDKITAEISSLKSEMSLNEDKSNLNVTIDASVNLAAIPLKLSDINYEDLSAMLSEKIYFLSENAFGLMKENSIDFFSLSNKIYLEDASFWKENKGSFLEKLPSLSVNLTVNTEFIKTGEEDNPLYNSK